MHLGVLSQLTDLAKKALLFSVYVLVFDQLRFMDLSTESLWVWWFAFIAYDFCYYWAHRMSHEMNILWAAHVVHHQSEEYNLTTALRQTSGGFFVFIFYLPLAIIGIDPIIILSVGSLNLVYQFWVHTRHIDKMPNWFEAIFVTPSNHRVHHAQNPVYIDKNYGGVFILWDRLFGTYHPELDEEPVIFGITKPLASWNPFWANLEVYIGLLKDAARANSWRDKIKIWFKRTGWRPADVAKTHPYPVFDPYRQVKYDVELTKLQKAYVLIQHVSTLGLSLLVLESASSLGSTELVFTLGCVAFGLFSLGYYQQLKSLAIAAEFVKVLLWGYLVILGPIAVENSLIFSLIWVLASLLHLALSLRQGLASTGQTSSGHVTGEP